MLVAVRMGCAPLPRWQRPRRRWMRRLRWASWARILAFTRNPFLVRVLKSRLLFKHRGKAKDFEFFQRKSPPDTGRFAWLGTSGSFALLVAILAGRLMLRRLLFSRRHGWPGDK